MKTKQPWQHIVHELTNTLQALESEKIALESELAGFVGQPMVQASPHWRNHKYLYLIHPTRSDGSRKREYIGADPSNIDTALAKVSRYEKFEETRKKLSDVERRLSGACRKLGYLLTELRARQGRLV